MGRKGDHALLCNVDTASQVQIDILHNAAMPLSSTCKSKEVKLEALGEHLTRASGKGMQVGSRVMPSSPMLTQPVRLRLVKVNAWHNAAMPLSSRCETEDTKPEALSTTPSCQANTDLDLQCS